MNEKTRPFSRTRFGTGYVSVIMIFVVICLTVLAALSLSAAGISKGQNSRAHEFMNMYCEAENRGNEKLMKIDEAALEAYGKGDFGKFADFALNEGLECTSTDDGYRVVWSEAVSERVYIAYDVTVFEDPAKHDKKRYEAAKKTTHTPKAG